MVDTDPTWLGAVLKKHARDNSIVEVLSIKTEPAVGVGDNYASIIVRAILQVVLGSGEVTTRRVIMKKALPDLPQDVAAEMSGIFILEGIVYKQIFSKYETLFNENNLPYDKLWPDCILASHNLILFEDLKASGFTLGTRKTGLDPAHAKIVFTNLARLHSLSLVATAKGIIYPKLLPSYMLIDSVVGETFIRTSLRALADVIRDTWSSEWSSVEKKIRLLEETVIPSLLSLYREPHKLSVVTHGDCWVNNMMFKYDNHGAPIDHKFLDFQISHYNSYGWDLTYFLHTSVHPKYIPTNYDSLIQLYCQEFSDNLERLGLDKSQAPTTEEVKNEMIRLRPFALAASCAVLPVVANPGDVKISLEELIKDSTKFRLLFEDNEFDQTIKDMLTNFANLGVL